MKRLMVCLFIVILVVSMIAGCAASSPADNDNQGQQPTTTAASYEGSGQKAGDAADYQRKVIKNVSLDLESKDARSAYAQILAYAVAHGGYEFSREQQTYDDRIVISAQIKIDPIFLDDFLAHISSVSDVISEKTASSDITADYFDARTRLITLEKSLLTYYDFLENAQNIDESLKVQKQIDDLTLQIETIKGRISLWDSLLAESTVSIYLRQVIDPVEAKREINWSTLSLDDMGYLIRAGVTTVLNAIVVVLQWAAIVLAVSSPLWIVALIIFLVIRRKRQRQKSAKAASEITQSTKQADTGEQRES